MSKQLMDDYTPPMVALQGVLAMKELFCLKPEGILDPSAGSGVFGQSFRVVWPEAHTSAIEPKRVESWFLSRNYDIFGIGKFQPKTAQGQYDLVMTNPPFHSWEEFVIDGLKMVRDGGYVCYLGLTAWGSRSESGFKLFDLFPPVAQMRIPGAVSYRPKGNDTRDYCYWVFRRPLPPDEESIPAWVSFNLPRLPGPMRRWHEGTKPGRRVNGEELQAGGTQYLLSTLRGGCLPRGVFVSAR